MATPSDIPKSAPGKVIINAQLFAAPGKGDRLQEHLAAIRHHSLSSEQPGCLEYRTVRSFVTEGQVKFAVFEVYTGVDAVHAHFKCPPFQTMAAEIEKGLLGGPPQIEYFYEFE